MVTVTKSICLYPRREAPSQTPSVPFSDLYNYMWAHSHFTEEKMDLGTQKVEAEGRIKPYVYHWYPRPCPLILLEAS